MDLTKIVFIPHFTPHYYYLSEQNRVILFRKFILIDYTLKSYEYLYRSLFINFLFCLTALIIYLYFLN